MNQQNQAHDAEMQRAQQQIDAQQKQLEAMQQQKQQQPQPQTTAATAGRPYSEVEKICGSQTARSNNRRRISEAQGGFTIEDVSHKKSATGLMFKLAFSYDFF